MTNENRGAGIPGNASPAVILWMIVLGAYSTINGMMTITQWSVYSTWTQLYYTLCMAAGTCLATLGFIEIGVRAKARFLAIAEAGVLVLLTANQFAGLLWNTILCYTPG